MPKLKLTYFDFHGGRGQTARLALTIGGLPFEDDRVGFTDWPTRKAGTIYGTLPELEIDGARLGQSNAINRYVGRLVGLYPQDNFQGALCDEVMDVVEDLNVQLVPTLFMPEEAKQARRKELADGCIPFYATRLEQRLNAQGGTYFADNRLTVADLKVFVMTRHLTSGVLDHIPTDLIERAAPSLTAHRDRVAAHDRVRAYYEKHGVQL